MRRRLKVGALVAVMVGVLTALTVATEQAHERETAIEEPAR
jgi:hypothetical protein